MHDEIAAAAGSEVEIHDVEIECHVANGMAHQAGNTT